MVGLDLFASFCDVELLGMHTMSRCAAERALPCSTRRLIALAAASRQLQCIAVLTYRPTRLLPAIIVIVVRKHGKGLDISISLIAGS